MSELYRYFANDGQLLYVGISLNTVARAVQHRNDKHWWDTVTTMTIERFPSREAAAVAEVEAIRTEGPLFNIQHGTWRPSKEEPEAFSPQNLAIIQDLIQTMPSFFDVPAELNRLGIPPPRVWRPWDASTLQSMVRSGKVKRRDSALRNAQLSELSGKAIVSALCSV